MRWLALVSLLSFACSDKDGPPPDARVADASDVGTEDADRDPDATTDAPVDAGEDAGDDAQVDAADDDAGEGDAAVDATTDADTTDVGPDPCITFTVGDPCTDDGMECGDDGRYTCDPDFRRCVPSGVRPICGGFAGARCPETGPFTQCVINSGASGGPCLRPEEVACACPAHADFYVCPE